MMAPIPWTIDDIVSATGGRLCFGDTSQRFSGIAIDSRRVSPQELFVAIKGEVHDGHRFADAAVDSGVKGLLIGRDTMAALPMERWRQMAVCCIAVGDTTLALGDLAAYNRDRAAVSVIAITGSNGKTSTRQMVSAVVSRRFSTLTPRGNFNNHIGLPLTLLSLSADHRWAVLELGMNHFGEIRRLGEICRPDVGIITNIGPAHLEGVGSIEGVADAKAELLETIRPDGTAVLNADDPRVAALAARTRCRTVDFGRARGAAVRAGHVTADGNRLVFDLSLPDGTVTVRLKTPGAFMVSNALAAAAAGHCIGLTAREIKSGIETFEPIHGRLNLVKLKNGIQLIDDTYNANPASMAAAIETLAGLRGGARGLMVAGDMLELGAHAAAAHRAVGEKAAASGIERLFVTGAFAASMAEGAGRRMDAKQIFIGDREQIIEALTLALRPGDWILVKGSRGMRMEKIVQGIEKWAER